MDCLDWGTDCLAQQGIAMQNSWEIVREMPWSGVYRTSSTEGRFFLKQSIPPFCIEAPLLVLLAQNHQQCLPKLLGHNKELSCFLMTDAGRPLRETLKQHYDCELVLRVIQEYAFIQRDCVDNIERLLQLPVPNWGIESLPQRYQQLLAQKDLLLADGLSLEEFTLLQRKAEVFITHCHQLQQYNIPQTVEHGDFHDNNILVKAGELTIHDWGDAIITHPFFSLIGFLDSARRAHGLDEASAAAQAIIERYLEQWLAYETMPRLQEAYKLATLINPIKFVLGFIRISQCPGMSGMGEYRGVITKALQRYIAQA